MSNKIFFTLFVISLLGVSYLVGMGGYLYQWYPSGIVEHAFQLYERQQKQERLLSREIQPGEIDKLLTNSRVVWDKNHADNGYTLLTLRYSTSVYLINMQGSIVYRWDLPYYDYWPNPRHAKKVGSEWLYIDKAILMPNGDLLATFASSISTPYGYGLVKVDKDSKLIWKYSENTHHDISIDPDTGNVLALIQRFTEKNEKPYNNISFPTLEDFVVILSADGKELRRISVLDAFYNSPYRILLNDYQKNIISWDRTHTNTISILNRKMALHFSQFKAGQLLISLRNMDTVAVLDLASRSIVWAYNGIWRAQHSPHFLANGNILLLDNKGYMENRKIYSRVLEFNPLTLGIEWEYPQNKKDRFFLDSYGRVQPLSSGNVLITDAMNGRVLEVTQNGLRAWEYKIPLILRKSDKNKEVLTMERNMPNFVEEPLLLTTNISGVIVSATRYKADDLPFLTTKFQ